MAPPVTRGRDAATSGSKQQTRGDDGSDSFEQFVRITLTDIKTTTSSLQDKMSNFEQLLELESARTSTIEKQTSLLEGKVRDLERLSRKITTHLSPKCQRLKTNSNASPEGIT